MIKQILYHNTWFIHISMEIHISSWSCYLTRFFLPDVLTHSVQHSQTDYHLILVWIQILSTMEDEAKLIRTCSVNLNHIVPGICIQNELSSVSDGFGYETVVSLRLSLGMYDWFITSFLKEQLRQRFFLSQ